MGGEWLQALLPPGMQSQASFLPGPPAHAQGAWLFMEAQPLGSLFQSVLPWEAGLTGHPLLCSGLRAGRGWQ